MIQNKHLGAFFLLGLFSSLARAEIGTTSAGGNDFSANAMQFIETLTTAETLSQFEFIKTYKPWNRPFLLVNRNDPTEFFSIQMTCPAAWTCHSIDGHKVSVVHGFAPTGFDLSHGNFAYVTAATLATSSDKNLKYMSLANPSLKVFYQAIIPYQINTSSHSSEFLSQLEKSSIFQIGTTIHEGAHLFLQLGKELGGTDSGWLNDPKLNRAAKRDAVGFCYGITTGQPAAELNVVADLWHDLVIGSGKEILVPKIKKWIAMRDLRYQQTSLGTSFGGIKPADCRMIDTVYLRLEGIADYLSFQTLLNSHKTNLEFIDWYYRNAVLARPLETLDSSWVLYAEGSLAAMLLDLFDSDKGWQKRVMREPESQLLDLLNHYLD